MLVEKTNQLIEETNELKELCVKKLGSEMFNYMDEDSFLLYKKTFQLMSTSMDAMIEQAKMIESINEKLNKLLDKKD